MHTTVNNKKTILMTQLCVFCSVSLWLLAGCSPAPSYDANADNSDKEKNTGTAVIRIAAASNLASVLPPILDSYKQRAKQENTYSNNTNPDAQIDIEVTYASSGKLYAQINAGAPYDIFLSADQYFPQQLAQQLKPLTATASDANSNHHLVDSRPFTYARGQLALYSSTQPLTSNKQMTKAELQRLFFHSTTHASDTTDNNNSSDAPHARKDTSNVSRISIANPALAPYGASAKAYLQSNGLYQTLGDTKRLIQAENIGQAFQYTHTGSTEYGFVALSQLIATQVEPTDYVILSPDSYPAILQDGIVLTDKAAARHIADYLHTHSAQQQFADAGYLPLL